MNSSRSTLRRIATDFSLVSLFMVLVLQAQAVEPLIASTMEWPSFGRDHSNQRFSPLSQINTQNVSKLVPKWIFQTGKKGSFQTQPLVIDEVMYITTPGNDVVALNAATGQQIWRYRHQYRKEKNKGGPANRGAAYADGRIFQATNDGRLLALEQSTGSVLWDRVIVTPTKQELAGLSDEQKQTLHNNINQLPAKMAPIVIGNTVVVGVTSAGYGIFYNFDTGVEDRPKDPNEFLGQRGFVGAYDSETGAEKWRWHTTKAQDWEGEFAQTTPDGAQLQRDIASEKSSASAYKESWRIGGSSTWMTPSYDSALGLIYVGTGNASPNDVFIARPGDNLYANSLVAIDVTTGETRWHYQQVPHDLWGYDVASTSVLFDYSVNGNKIPAIAIAGKTGWVYVHDRRDGQLLFKSEAVVPQSNLFKAPTEQGTLAAPGSFGGVSWSPTSYDSSRRLFFVAAIHKPSRYFLRHGNYGGKKTPYIEYGLATDQASWGTLTALDFTAAGKIKWQVKTELPLIGGLLATAGDLVFVGGGDGFFNAHNASSGKHLWQFNCGAGVNAPPVSYQIGSQQFIAVAAGGHRLMGYPGGDAMIAFGLPD
ncbi:MAG: outer membrane protein assembly factor BamB family protein [Gammaproteobacteria bacterium]